MRQRAKCVGFGRHQALQSLGRNRPAILIKDAGVLAIVGDLDAKMSLSRYYLPTDFNAGLCGNVTASDVLQEVRQVGNDRLAGTSKHESERTQRVIGGPQVA